jgi:hypothetical protein
MNYEITAQSAYLRVDVFDRLLGPAGENCLRQIAAESRKRRRSRILVNSRGSRPMSEFDYYMLIKLAEALNSEGEFNIALIGKTAEPRQLNQFGKTVARDEELNDRDGEPAVMAFTDASVALNWLLRDAQPACGTHP